MLTPTHKSFIKKGLAGLLIFAVINVICLKVFNEGLKQYYCLWPAEILVIGHSMSEMAIDRDLLEQLTGRSVAKYCMNGTSVPDRLVMIRHYIETVGQKPQAILYDIGPRSFSSGLAVNSHALFYPFIGESPVIDRYVRQNATWGEYMVKKAIPLTRYDDSRLGAVIRGYRHDWKTRSLKRLNQGLFIRQLANGNYWKTELSPEIQTVFEETLDYLEAENIHLFLLQLPNVDLLDNAEPEKNAEVMDYIKKTIAKHPNITFIDANSPYCSRYDLFGDPLHLNPKGQQEITTFLSSKIHLPPRE